MSVNVGVDALSDTDLRARLEEHNIPVGPIVASTRALYRKKLLRILYGSNEINESGGPPRPDHSDDPVFTKILSLIGHAAVGYYNSFDHDEGMRQPIAALQDSVGGYEASMESSDHDQFLKQEAQSSACMRHRLRSSKGSYSGDSHRELVVNKGNVEGSKAVTIQLYLIVILMVAILCLCIYLYLSWYTESTYDAYNAIEVAAKAALKKTNQ